MLDAIDSTLPSRLVDAMYPRHTTSGRAKGGELGPHLVGQTIRFRDQKTDFVVECTIQDCGTSHLRGEWFEVIYGAATGSQQISKLELRDIMANYVQ
jgi:hypothetical protein